MIPCFDVGCEVEGSKIIPLYGLFLILFSPLMLPWIWTEVMVPVPWDRRGENFDYQGGGEVI